MNGFEETPIGGPTIDEFFIISSMTPTGGPTEEFPRYRYATNAFGWWLHDVFIHPISGTIGLVGKMCGSLRLMALAHHLHNVTAPSDDPVENYLLASRRAGKNEYFGPQPRLDRYSNGEKIAAEAFRLDRLVIQLQGNLSEMKVQMKRLTDRISQLESVCVCSKINSPLEKD